MFTTMHTAHGHDGFDHDHIPFDASKLGPPAWATDYQAQFANADHTGGPSRLRSPRPPVDTPPDDDASTDDDVFEDALESQEMADAGTARFTTEALKVGHDARLD